MVEQVMLAMNAAGFGRGQVAAPGQVFHHLRSIAGPRVGMLAVRHQLQIDLAHPIVGGRSDLGVFYRHRAQYAPLCVIEAKSDNESSCGAVAEGLIAVAALGIHHNLPFVNGIATNLRRWTFFRVEPQGFYVSREDTDLTFRGGVPVRRPLSAQDLDPAPDTRAHCCLDG